MKCSQWQCLQVGEFSASPLIILVTFLSLQCIKQTLEALHIAIFINDTQSIFDPNIIAVKLIVICHFQAAFFLVVKMSLVSCKYVHMNM